MSAIVDAEASLPAATFCVGQIVAVASRTGPGENELGGIARIVRVHPTPVVVYDVKYVLDGRIEHGLPSMHLKPHTFQRRRHCLQTRRQYTLGRCQRCGSLRADCGSCDHMQENSSLLLLNKEKNDKDEYSSSSSESSTDVDALLRESRRRFARYKKKQAEALSLLRSTDFGTKKAGSDSELDDETTSVSKTTATIRRKVRSKNNDGGILAAVTAVATQLDETDSDSSMSAKEANVGQNVAFRTSAVPSVLPDAEGQPSGDFYSEEYTADDFGYSADEDGEDDFIQPEGNADQLPKDVTDGTAQLSKEEIAPFLTATMDRVEAQIEDFKKEVAASAENSSKDRKLLHNKMVKDLVRNGIDQCNRAMRRLRDDVLELRLDNLSSSVQGIIVSATKLGFSDDDKDDGFDEGDDNGWADPDQQSPVRLVPIGCASPDKNKFDDDAEETLDPHPFAMRKRKPGLANGGKKRKHRSNGRRRVSKRRVLSNKQPSRHTEVEDGLGRSSSDESSLHETTASEPRAAKRQRRAAVTSSKLSSNNPETEFLVQAKNAWNQFFEDVPVPSHSLDVPEEPSMADRMERWVKKNTRSRRRPKNANPSHERRRPRNVPTPSTKSRELDNNELSFDALLSRSLPNSHNQTIEGESAAVRLENPQHAHVDARGADAPHNPVHDSERERSGTPASCCVQDNPAQVFGLLRTDLTRNGPRTLQELISENKLIDLRSVVLALKKLVRLLKDGANDLLSPSDGIVYLIFGKDSCVHFMDCVLVQLVDSVMSVLHPTAWGISPSNGPEILRILEPLRLALGSHYLLIERVSRCVLYELSVQEWRIAQGGEAVYISSVCPLVWQNLLNTGMTSMSRPRCSRFALFKNIIPRCEVECVWKLFAYFAGSGSIRWIGETKETCRFQLLNQMISKSSLSAASGDTKLAPSQGQISAAVSDVSRVAVLLKSGAMGELPRRDKILFDLVHRAITLQGEAILFGAASFLPLHLKEDNEMVEKEFIQSLLKSGICNESFNLRTLPGEKNMSPLQWMSQPLILPSSSLLQACIMLVVSWRDGLRFPERNEKRFRLFQKSVNTLIEGLTSSTPATLGDQDSSDPFLSTFVQNESVDDAQLKCRIFKLESAALISIFSGSPTSVEVCETIDWSSLASHCKDVWGIVSDLTMKARRSWIAQNDAQTQKPTDQVRGSLRLQIASKAMSCLFLSIIRKLDGFLDQGETIVLGEAAAGSLCFIISCVLTCLDCFCDWMYDARSTSMSHCHLAVMASAVSKIARRRNCTLETIFVSKGWSIVKKSAVFSRSLSKLVSREICGTSEDLSFQSLLVAVILFAGAFPQALLQTSLDSRRRAPPPTDHAYELLLSALQESRPSARHSITVRNTVLSSHGMCLVSKRHSLVCCCLSRLIHPTWHRNAIRNCMAVTTFVYTYDPDNLYRRKTSATLLRELCREYCSNPTLLPIFSVSEVLLGFLTDVLDFSTVRKSPSSNLQRIRSEAGNEAEENAFDMLVAYARRNSHSGAEVQGWRSFARQVGTIFRDLNEDSLSSALASYGRENTVGDMAPSIERECLERFTLAVKVLKLCSDSKDLPLERILQGLISSSCCNMVEITLNASIRTRSLQNSTKDSFRVARYLEFFSCCSEIFVGLLAFAFSFASERAFSESLIELLVTVADRFIAPVLRQPDVDLQACLVSVVAPSRGASLANQSQASKVPLEKLSEIVRENIIRRYKQFILGVVSIPRVGQTSLLPAFFYGVRENAIYEASLNGFSPYHTRGMCSMDSNTPLQPRLDKVFAELIAACSRSTSAGLTRKISCLRLKSLEVHLIPRLKSQKSLQALRAIRALLDIVIDEALEKGTLRAQTACALTQGIWTVAETALSGYAFVRNDSLLECFLCARSFCEIPASNINASVTGRLVDFVKTSSNAEDQFLWAALCFLRDVGVKIVSGSPSEVFDFRRSLRDNCTLGNNRVTWPILASTDKHVALRLTESQASNSGPVMNVYANRVHNRAFTEPLAKPWQPPTRLVSAVDDLSLVID